MRGLVQLLGMLGIVLFSFVNLPASPNLSPSDDRDSIVIVMKDGHRQSLSSAEIQRIEIKAPASIIYKDGHREKISVEIERIEFSDSDLASMKPGRAHYIGKWEVGDGNGSQFFITLEADGRARKTVGPPHGTWTLVDGEARISWDDGWHDAIRRVDGKHEKRAFEPGKSFDDAPSNVTPARNMQPKSI